MQGSGSEYQTDLEGWYWGMGFRVQGLQVCEVWALHHFLCWLRGVFSSLTRCSCAIRVMVLAINTIRTFLYWEDRVLGLASAVIGIAMLT